MRCALSRSDTSSRREFRRSELHCMLRVIAIIVFGIYALAILALVLAYFLDTNSNAAAGPPEPPVAQHEAEQRTP